MGVLSSEAVVLRTWPVHESDLIVSFFTRDYGRVRGVAKAALKSRKRFGGALEPMTVARAWFAERPRQELVRLDQLEIVRSPLSAPVDHLRMAVLSLYAELLDEALPEHDPQETVFRLLLSVLEQTHVAQTHVAQTHVAQTHVAQTHVAQTHVAQTLAAQAQPVQTSVVGANAQEPDQAQTNTTQPWMPLTYFLLWMTRLMGLLPDVHRCTACGEPLQAEEVWFHSYSDGLFCAVHHNGNADGLTTDSWQLAQRMLRAPVSAFAAEPWPRRRGVDLRRFALQSIERHLERKLRTAEALARLGG